MVWIAEGVLAVKARGPRFGGRPSWAAATGPTCGRRKVWVRGEARTKLGGVTVRGGSLRPLPDAVDVIVVGAGIMGLATAYHLAKEHPRRRILVLDAGYLCGGASGRNGGGVRAQWSSEANVRLMQESLAMCKEFAHEHRINTWFRQGGYLF